MKYSKVLKWIWFSILLVIMTAGCAKKTDNTQVNTNSDEKDNETEKEAAGEADITSAAEMITGTPAPHIAEESVIEVPTPQVTAAADLQAQSQTEASDYSQLLINETGKTVIRRLPITGDFDFTFLIVSQSGVSILCEPQNPPKEIIPDIVTFSHDHHRDYTFINRITQEAPDTIIAVGDKEDLKVTTFEDVTLQGIAASHNGSDFSVNPTLVMQTFDIDGMRIVYIGDVYQTEFTKEQMDALGKVDIALVTLDNYPGWISVETSINLMKQLNPKIMIPIKHQNAKFEEAIDQLNKEFPNKEVYDGEWAISKEDLADGVQKIVVIKPVE